MIIMLSRNHFRTNVQLINNHPNRWCKLILWSLTLLLIIFTMTSLNVCKGAEHDDYVDEPMDHKSPSGLHDGGNEETHHQRQLTDGPGRSPKHPSESEGSFTMEPRQKIKTTPSGNQSVTPKPTKASTSPTNAPPTNLTTGIPPTKPHPNPTTAPSPPPPLEGFTTNDPIIGNNQYPKILEKQLKVVQNKSIEKILYNNQLVQALRDFNSWLLYS